MVCEICHEREATVHTKTVHERTFSRHLCQQCLEEREGHRIVEGVEQNCHYCGQPCEFGFGSGKISIEIPGIVACCRECGEDFKDYVQNHIGAEPSSEDEFTRNLEVFMKKRIAERESEQ